MEVGEVRHQNSLGGGSSHNAQEPEVVAEAVVHEDRVHRTDSPGFVVLDCYDACNYRDDHTDLLLAEEHKEPPACHQAQRRLGLHSV